MKLNYAFTVVAYFVRSLVYIICFKVERNQNDYAIVSSSPVNDYDMIFLSFKTIKVSSVVRFPCDKTFPENGPEYRYSKNKYQNKLNCINKMLLFLKEYLSF